MQKMHQPDTRFHSRGKTTASIAGIACRSGLDNRGAADLFRTGRQANLWLAHLSGAPRSVSSAVKGRRSRPDPCLARRSL